MTVAAVADCEKNSELCHLEIYVWRSLRFVAMILGVQLGQEFYSIDFLQQVS
jgi:hypothetical protein